MQNSTSATYCIRYGTAKVILIWKNIDQSAKTSRREKKSNFATLNTKSVKKDIMTQNW